MAHYKPIFSLGSRVRVTSGPQLRDFQAMWKYHNPLTSEQLDYANAVAIVEEMGFYHGGDVLYELVGLPGIWHECCLSSAETNSE